jgi:hypothetical protein
VQHFFATAEFRVKSDRRTIAVISLHEDNVSAPLNSDLPQTLDHRRGDPFASVRCAYRKIIDVDFASLLFELAQFVRRKRTEMKEFEANSSRK